MRRATWLSLVWCVACSPANPAPGDGTDPIDTVRLCTSDDSSTGRYVFEYVELCYAP
ncbi:MAG: hypothetical protein RIT81_10610 [Deltaproteobacteria bacterium]